MTSIGSARSRRSVTITCWIVAALLAACSSKEEKFATHLANAEKYIAAGQDKEAMVELKSALQVDPKSAEINWRIAELLRGQQKYADARFFYREVSRLDPSRTDAILLEAGLSYGDEPQRAEELIQSVIQRDPTNPEAHLRLSELAMVRADLDEALAQARIAAELDPKKGLYQHQIGLVHRTRVREKALNGETADDAIFRYAIEAFQKADALDGPYWAYQIEIARVYGAWAGHFEEAKAAYRKAVETAIQSGEKNADANAAIEARNYAATIQDREFQLWALQTLTRVRPQEVSAWAELAGLEELAGGSGEAIFQQLLEKNPDLLAAHVTYSNWLVSKDRKDEAVAHLLQAVERGVDPADGLGAVANLQFRLARFDDARATIERLRAEQPSHPRTTLAEAQLAVSEGRIGDAAKILRESPTTQNRPEALRMLAFCEMTMNNLPAATQAINRAVELSPELDPTIVRLQAQIQHLSKDYSGSVQSFRKLAQNGHTITPMEEMRWVQSLYESGFANNGRARLEKMLEKPDAPVEAALEYAYRELNTDRAKVYAVLDTALERNPGEPRLVQYLTELDIQENRAPRALERLNLVMATPPVSPLVLMTRARLLASQQQWALAETDLRALFEAAPGFPGVSDLLITVLRQQGKLEDAITSLEEASRRSTLGPSQLYLLGRLYYEKKDVAKALDYYEKTLAAKPDASEAKNDLAWLLADSGSDLERALLLAQEAQQARPNDPAVADTLGWIYLRKGLNDPAVQQLRYAVELAAANRTPRPVYHLHLAHALKTLGRPDEARGEVQKALALDPQNAEAAKAKQELDALQAAQAASPNPS
jgi:tetratricopeptide (TPR) repeat protein